MKGGLCGRRGGAGPVLGTGRILIWFILYLIVTNLTKLCAATIQTTFFTTYEHIL